MAEGRSGARDSEGGRRTGAGASDDGSSDGGAVELSLQLRTGSTAAAEEKEEKAAAAAARRSMTIFYNGRVCAADVTELQAWAIISMVNQEIFTQQQQQRRDHGRHHQDSSGDGGHQNPTPAAPLRAAHCHAAPSSHQVLSEAAPTPPLISHAAAGLSMKRSLQRFLQKRKTRTAAVASRYAGARPDQPMKP